MVSIVFRLVVCEAHGSGRSSAISRSKRRNVMATRKNFIEKGRRADPMGSNPHSYGLVFLNTRSVGEVRMRWLRVM